MSNYKQITVVFKQDEWKIIKEIFKPEFNKSAIVKKYFFSGLKKDPSIAKKLKNIL